MMSSASARGAALRLPPHGSPTTVAWVLPIGRDSCGFMHTAGWHATHARDVDVAASAAGFLAFDHSISYRDAFRLAAVETGRLHENRLVGEQPSSSQTTRGRIARTTFTARC